MSRIVYIIKQSRRKYFDSAKHKVLIDKMQRLGSEKSMNEVGFYEIDDTVTTR